MLKYKIEQGRDDWITLQIVEQSTNLYQLKTTKYGNVMIVSAIHPYYHVGIKRLFIRGINPYHDNDKLPIPILHIYDVIKAIKILNEDIP